MRYANRRENQTVKPGSEKARVPAHSRLIWCARLMNGWKRAPNGSPAGSHFAPVTYNEVTQG